MPNTISIIELQKYSLSELQMLYRKTQIELANYPLGSNQYQSLLASLQNINRVIQAQRINRLKPPGF